MSYPTPTFDDITISLVKSASLVLAAPQTGSGAPVWRKLAYGDILGLGPAAKLTVGGPDGAAQLDANGTASALTVTPANGTNASLANLLGGVTPLPKIQVSSQFVLGAGTADAVSHSFSGSTYYISADGGTTSFTYSAPLHFFSGNVDVTGNFNPHYISQNFSTAATANEQILGLWSQITNTAANYAAGGWRLDYTSNALVSNGSFDTAATIYSIPTTLQTTGGQSLGLFVRAQSSYDTGTTGAGGSFASELNNANLGQDLGWAATRGSLLWWNGVLQIVPEVGFSGAGKGEGKDLLYHVVIGHSGSVSTTLNRNVKSYNGILFEPNFAVAGTGRGIYMSGDATGTEQPFSAFQLALDWLHGIRLDNATFADNNALAVNNSHTIEWAATPTDPNTPGTVSLSIGQKNKSLTVSGPVQPGVYTVAALPTGITGARATVTDSTLSYSGANLGATLTGGGTNTVPVWYNGTAWVIGG